MTRQSRQQFSAVKFITQGIKPIGLMLMAGACVSILGCRQSNEKSARRIAQQFESEATKTDSLRSGMRFLAQMQPFSHDNYIEEVQKQLNSWIQSADRSKASYSPSSSLNKIPKEALQAVGAANPLALQFSYLDVDYLFQCYLTSKLAGWVTGFPLRDNLIAEYLKVHQDELSEADFLKLEQACKLFDWSTRNIMLDGLGASVELPTENPVGMTSDDIVGAGYLPWESLLFSNGDYVERGRVFSSLIAQRGIHSFWVCSDADVGNGKLWAVGVPLGGQVFLFEPKLGMPIVHPDEMRLATLKDARENPRVLRRLDLPGQFDYAVTSEDLQQPKLVVDVTPCADSARMKMLESALLQDERMVTYQNADAQIADAKTLVPDATVELWMMPLFAQLRALETREMAKTMTDEAMRYMSVHGVWLLKNPASEGRVKHLLGQFENTSDGQQGALDLYMDSRVDDQTIQRLAFNPEVQEELGLKREIGEAAERHEQRLRQAQLVYTRAKVDAAFLLAQLHFDRGNYSQASSFLDRVLRDERAVLWHPTARYCQARIAQEQLDLAVVNTELASQPNQQEAGNRIRLRYFNRLHPSKSSEAKSSEAKPGDAGTAVSREGNGAE